MKVLVTGAGGQVGRALLSSAPEDVEVIGCDKASLDITDPAAVSAKIARIAPDLIINAAAHTAVDTAESESEHVFAINRDGVTNLAATGVQLVQISTDFVFDGTGSSPYPIDAPTGPIGMYGASKLAGEQAAGDNALIVRTAWVHASEGSNFVLTMLKLMRDLGSVRVITDQVGTPTWATSLAQALWAMIGKDLRGVYHFTDSGVATWYDFAVAIAEEATALGLLDSMPQVRPVTTAAFPTAARRPAYSVLDKTVTYDLLGPAPHWRVNLRKMLAEVKARG